MSKKKRASPVRKATSATGDKRRALSRRSLLAALGLGVAVPAMRASGKEPDFDKLFDEYWEQVKADIAERDAERVPKKKEILELRIQYRRNAVMLTIDRSRYNSMCNKATPVPSPPPAKPR